MRRNATELLDPWLSGGWMTSDQFLWTMLVFGLIFAMIHLVLMLMTRWRDRRITANALIFSIVVHISCISGMVAIKPRILGIPEGGRQEEQEAIIHLGQADSDEVANSTEETAEGIDDKTPVWDQITKPEPVPSSRLDRISQTPPQAENVREEPTPAAQPMADVEPPKSVPEIFATAQPKPETVAIATVRKQAVSTPTIDEATTEGRADVAAPPPVLTREREPFTELAKSDVQRDPKPNMLNRINAKIDLESSAAQIDRPMNPAAELKRASNPARENRSVGPAPSSSTVVEPEPAVGAAVASRGSAGGGGASSLLQRSLTASIPGDSEPTVERLRPESDGAATGPLQSPIVVRDVGDTELARIGPTPGVMRPEFDEMRSRKNTGFPSTYRLRNLARRKDIAREFGGTDESEAAVEAALKWLAQNQHADGYWDADAHGAGKVKIDETGTDRNYAGKDADSGVTALAVLAFLAAGYTHEEGQYAEQVDRALKWLIRQQRADGNLAFGSGKYAMMYCHAMATYAIAEAYGMQADPSTDTRLREPVSKAVAFILSRQNPVDGGWRYEVGTEGDVSIFGWQLMALKSAEVAGVRIPAAARSKMIGFLKSRSLGDHEGLAGYRKGATPSPSMTAEALFCKQMLGIKRSNAASIEAAEYLVTRAPKRAEWNEYYWYYGTLAMYQYGGKEWQNWNEALRDQLIAEQKTSGSQAGSWDPKGPWGPYGGRVYSTALSTLCLEVYYRFLPLYQMGGRYNEE